MDTTSTALSKHASNKTVSTHAPRRLRSLAEKRAIVEETLEPGASVAVVARRHEVNANLVFGWRKLYRAGLLIDTTAAPAALVPVRTKRATRPKVCAPRLPEAAATVIDIILPKGRIRLSGEIPAHLLHQMIETLT